MYIESYLYLTDSETKIQMYRISLGENGTQIHVSIEMSDWFNYIY